MRHCRINDSMIRSILPPSDCFFVWICGGRCRSESAGSPYTLLRFFAMALFLRTSSAKHALLPSLIVLLLCVAPHRLDSQATQAPQEQKLAVPAWAVPGAATQEQGKPPADF